MVALAGILLLAGARIAFQTGEVSYFDFDRGIALPSANLWIDSDRLTMIVNTALILATALSWMLVIQFFNPFRALTTLPASFFLLMMLSVPDFTDQLYTGTVLGAVMPLCVALLWSAFADPGALRRIYLIFVILSALSMTQYCFAVYIPVFIVGCFQMKIFSMRTIVAILLGLVTPWWIVFGLGLVSPGDIHLPDSANFFSGFETDEFVSSMAVIGITVLLLIIGWVASFMNVLTLNANLRAFNGNISLIGLTTLLAMAIDFGNVPSYLPLLMLIASYELSYMFGINKGKRRFIPILAIMAVYVAIFVNRIFIDAF